MSLLLPEAGTHLTHPPPLTLVVCAVSCGKQLRSEQDAQAHAARSKHTNFSESTEDVRPLTAEEKQEQLAKSA